MRAAKGSENVFVDCGFPPASAEKPRLRAKIMMSLTVIQESHIQERKGCSRSCALQARRAFMHAYITAALTSRSSFGNSLSRCALPRSNRLTCFPALMPPPELSP